MKTIRAVFHNGHLWNPDTEQRIVFREKSEVVITVSGNDSLHDVDPNNEPPRTIQTESDQLSKLEATALLERDKGNYFEYRRILRRGEKLYFMINAGVRDKDKTDLMKAYFEVILLEDLYIVRTKNTEKDGRVEPCACIVGKEYGYNLPYFEAVQAYSLNDAYSKTFVLYFNIFGKGTANVYDRFYTQPNRNRQYLLNRLRTFSE